MKKLRFLSLFLVLAMCFTLFSTTALAAPEQPEDNSPMVVAAKAAILVDGDTGQILFEQNAHEKHYPASITKCLTTLLVLEAMQRGELKADQVLTVSQTAIDSLPSDGSSAGLKVGEQLTVEQLLYCVMVPSANEACVVLAETISGSQDAFVEKMNARAKELGCENTHFVNACGLHDPDHYTSAYDTYLIVKEALKYPMFITLCGTKEYTLPATNLQEAHKFHTTNALLDQWRMSGYLYPYAKGIKTGHTSDAGYCLAAYAEKGDRQLISVVLGAQAVKNSAYSNNTEFQSFSETKRLFEWGFNNFRTATILDHTAPVEQLPVTLSHKMNYVVAHPAHDVEALLPKEIAVEDLQQKITMDAESVEAPVTEGQKLGSITVADSKGTVYATVDLLAANDVPASKILTAIHRVKVFWDNPLVKIAVIIVLILLIVVLVKYFRRRPKRYRGGQSYRTRKRNSAYRGKRR